MEPISLSKIITSGIIKECVKEGIKLLKNVLKTSNTELITSKEDLESSILEHNRFILNTTSNVGFKESKSLKRLTDVYIDLDIQLQPKRLKSKDDESTKYNIEHILENNNGEHIIILGGPGAGKTTTIKHICQMLFEDKFKINYKFPILILLRDITDNESIYSKLRTIFGIEISSKANDKSNSIESVELRQKYINSYLNSLNVILILDGFDEVKPSRIDGFYKEIKSLMDNLDNTLVILTSRTVSYSYYIENTNEYELCDLDENQIIDFTNKWFYDKNDSEDFLFSLNKSKFYDLSLKPLTLAHLCAIYERTKKFYDKPKYIYKKLVNILIEEWDEQRGILRESKYSDFDNERKFEFLCNFAYELTISYDNKLYSEENFKSSYLKIYSNYDLPKKDCEKVVKEIEEHNGIIIKSSYDSYEFVHKSMQEYLSAEHIVKMPTIPSKLMYDINISNELAISVSLSSIPNEYYYKLVFEIFKIEKITPQFVIEFFSRLVYEKPSFRESILIPLGLITTFDILISNSKIFDRDTIDNEFDNKFNLIFRNFLTDFNFKKSIRILSTCVRLDYVSLDSAYIKFKSNIKDLTEDDEYYYVSHITKTYIISNSIYENYLKY